MRAGARSLDNGLVALTVGRDGTVTLADRRTGLLYPALLGLESSGDIGDTYTYAPPVRDRVRRVRGRPSVRVLARGPLVATLEVRSTLACGSGPGGRAVAADPHADSAALRCTVELDNRATDHRLRLRVPSGVPAVPAVAGGPFGPVTRQAIVADAARYPRETPVTTAPAQRYVAVALGTRGLALLAPGFFEYELARRRRSPDDPSPLRGPPVPRRSSHSPRTRGMAHADARGPVPGCRPSPARRGARRRRRAPGRERASGVVGRRVPSASGSLAPPGDAPSDPRPGRSARGRRPRPLGGQAGLAPAVWCCAATTRVRSRSRAAGGSDGLRRAPHWFGPTNGVPGPSPWPTVVARSRSTPAPGPS